MKKIFYPINRLVCLIMGHKITYPNIEKYTVEQVIKGEYKEDNPRIDPFDKLTLHKCPRCGLKRNANDYLYGN